MAKDHRFYRNLHPGRFFLRLGVALVALCIFLAIFFYVWFKRYIVYTDDGLYLDIPWMEDLDRDRGTE